MNISRKRLLKKKLTTTHISKIDIVASYQMKILELRDQVSIVGDRVDDNELVWISPNGFSPSWCNFV